MSIGRLNPFRCACDSRDPTPSSLRERNFVSSTLDRVFAWACAHGADAIVMHGAKLLRKFSVPKPQTTQSSNWRWSYWRSLDHPPRPPFACNLGGFLHPRHFFIVHSHLKPWELVIVSQATLCWAYPWGGFLRQNDSSAERVRSTDLFFARRCLPVQF